MEQRQAVSLYEEIRAGSRTRLPNGFWRGVGRQGACSLLRYALETLGLSEREIRARFGRGLLVAIKLNSAAQVLFHNNHTEFLLTAYPHFRTQDVASRRAQVEKDEQYFDQIDTEERAYLLGLLAADGNVTDNNQVSLWVKHEDRALVDLLGTALNLRPYRPKHRTRDDTYGVVVCSARLARALERHGIVPRKSLTLGWPSTVPKTLQHHFMRGLLDGDGSVSAIQWTFTSGSERFVREYRRRAQEIVGVELPLNRVGKNRRTWVVTGGRNTWRFLDWLYEGTSIYHEGKHSRYVMGKRDIAALAPIQPINHRRTGRRGRTAEVGCSVCGTSVRVAESRTHSSYLFCQACRNQHSVQLLIKNQGPKAGASPKRAKPTDDDLRRKLVQLQVDSGGRLPPLWRIRELVGDETVRGIRERGGLRRLATHWGLTPAIHQPGRFDALADVLLDLDVVADQLGFFPTESQLRQLGRYDLINAIQKKHKGIRAVRAARDCFRQVPPEVLEEVPQ